MIKIHLPKNKYALIDNEDFALVNQFSWYITNKGYAATKTRKYSFLMHRLVMNISKGEVIDHINFNPLDNRKRNLRICSQQQNSFHSRLSKNNTSGYKGVYLNKRLNKWVVQIMVSRKCIPLGLFEDIEKAVFTRKEAEKTYFGQFANI